MPDLPSTSYSENIPSTPKSKNRVIAEYALRDMIKPIGVSTYQLQNALPEQTRESLPTIEELEAQLNSVSVKAED